MNRAPLPSITKAFVSALLRLLMMTSLVFAVGGLGQAVPTAHASVLTLVVDRTDDPDPPESSCTIAADDCSLRDAIIKANANPGSTVQLAHGVTYILSIVASPGDDATTGDLNITANMDFAYPPGLCLYNCAATIQGGVIFWFDRIISIGTSATVHMPSIIIRHGFLSSGDGGGISNWGTLTLNGATLTDSGATRGGGIFNIGILTIPNSSILTNTASTTGGGLHNNYPGTTFLTNTVIMGNTAASTGGGLKNEGTMTVTNSTIKSNTALSGGGISGSQSLAVSGSTVISNTASTSSGGGIASAGTMTLTDTTVSGNTATGAGGGIYTGGPATLTNVAVTNNKALMTPNSLSDGGGIVSYGGNLAITGSIVSGNSTDHGHGGGISFQADSFVMTTSTVANNSSDGLGGGLYLATKTSSVMTSTIAGNSMNSAGNIGGGGILLNSGALTITNSVIGDNGASGDTLTPGGGLFNNFGANVTVQSTTISGNHAPYGGIFNGGTLTMTNTTVSGNTALTGQGGGLNNNGVASLYNSTIANNSAPSGSAGGIYAGGTVKLRDTLLAGNSSPSSPDCGSTIVSLGHNLLGISSGCTGLTNGVNGDRVGSLAAPLDPKIGPLANNGGSNSTHALLDLSPAIDAGDPAPATCPPTDQRGTARPIYAVCDIGAYEYRGPDMHLPLVIK